MIQNDWLHAFVAFARLKNFTRAAAELGLTQPALHTKIGKLAEFLAVPLYQRRGRGLELTPEGERVAAFARDMQGQAVAFLAELAGQAASVPVVLAAGEGAYRYLLAEAITTFTRRKEAPLRLLTRDRKGTLEAVRTGEAQLGVTVLADLPEDLEHRLLATVGHLVAVPARHPLSRRKRLTVQDLAGERLIAPPAGFPHRAALFDAITARGLSADFAVEASGWELMLHFVGLGAGIAVVNDCCRLSRGIVGVPFEGLPPVRYHLLRRKDRPLSRAAAAFAALLTARLR